MFCIHCGKQIDSNSAFCTICGQSQQQNQTTAPPIGMATTNQSGYHNLLAANNLAQNVKHFEGLFTQVAVSENGYMASYYPYEPERKKAVSALKTAIEPEQQERLEILHISQINSFDIECSDQTKVSGGAGGAVAGALIGGIFGFSGAGAVIGSSASSGKVTQNITDITLIVNTKDFNNPRVEVPLYRKKPVKGAYDIYSYQPFALRKHYSAWKGFDKEGRKLLKEVYACNDLTKWQPNIPLIDTLGSTLTQMLAAHKQSEAAASAAPQLSSADELAKFKSLLDSGVITQEEFAQKKRQLLGL